MAATPIGNKLSFSRLSPSQLVSGGVAATGTRDGLFRSGEQMPRKTDLGQFAIVPIWIALEATPLAVKVFAVLAGKYANQEDKAWPARKTLADLCGVSVDSIDRAILCLTDIGALDVSPRIDERGQSSNLYFLRFVRPPLGTGAHEGVGMVAEGGLGTGAAQTIPIENQTQEEPLEAKASTTAAVLRLKTLVRKHLGHTPTPSQIEELEGFAATHPPECVEWVLKEVGDGAKRTWRIVKYKFGDCAKEGHGPRTFKGGKNGISQRPATSIAAADLSDFDAFS